MHDPEPVEVVQPDPHATFAVFPAPSVQLAPPTPCVFDVHVPLSLPVETVKVVDAQVTDNVAFDGGGIGLASDPAHGKARPVF